MAAISDTEKGRLNQLHGLFKRIGFGTLFQGIQNDVDALKKYEVLAEATGTGAEQELDHTMGAVPGVVLVVPTLIDVTSAGADFSVAYGTHTATKIKVTVTTGAKFIVYVKK